MKLLLDTHVWIWSQERAEAIGPRARRLLLAGTTEVFVCAISTLEIARLAAVGTVATAMPLAEWVRQSLADLGARTLPLSHEVAIEAYSLPGPFHKDPADRILVAAARLHQLTFLTADERILGYREVCSVDARK